jgi:hypothetical protein
MKDGAISGPYDSAGLQVQTQSSGHCLVWGRGFSEWVSPHKWKTLESELSQHLHSQRAQHERMWRVRVQEQEYEPMLMDQLLTLLKSQTDYNDIFVWTEGYSDWKAVYELHRIMDQLGVPRRKYPRVPLMGEVVCEATSGNFVARALSISEGGLGITDCPPLKIGEKFKVILKSPNLFQAIHATAEVVYIGQDNYVGVKFIGLQTESKASIIEYVKKYLETIPGES